MRDALGGTMYFDVVGLTFDQESHCSGVVGQGRKCGQRTLAFSFPSIEKGLVMKIMIWNTVGAAVLWSGVAAADPFLGCESASNYGYNIVSNFVSSAYDKANCDRGLASQYEQFLPVILPPYLGQIGKTSTQENGGCLLRGCYEGWVVQTEEAYQNCGEKSGFEAIDQGLLGTVASSLFNAFYWGATAYYTEKNVPTFFAYPFSPGDPALSLTRNGIACEANIRATLSGVPQALVTALVVTVCS